MSVFRSALLCLLSLAVGLPALPAAADEAAQTLVQHPAVASADWAAVSEQVVELHDNNYEPNNLSFKVGKPYKLVLRSVGGAAHDMVGGSFFDQEVIAMRMINTRSGRVIADTIRSIYIRPKQETEVWFVPIKTGSYTFYCSLPGHRQSGMEGEVRIVE